MSLLEPADTIEATVGATRHPTDHIARAVSTEQRVYLLHSTRCVDAHAHQEADLRECLFSLALDEGIDLELWAGYQDRPVIVDIDEEYGDLKPIHTHTTTNEGTQP